MYYLIWFLKFSKIEFDHHRDFGGKKKIKKGGKEEKEEKEKG